MSNKQNHIRQVLKRWISGDITATEEQRLDTAARGDQFLKEALSGLRATTENDHAQNIARLRKQLNNHQKKKSLIAMPILRIAAAIALLIVAGWLVWTEPALNSSADMAMKTAEPEMQAPIQNTINTEDAIEKDQTPTANGLAVPESGLNTKKRSKPSSPRHTEQITQSKAVPADFSVSTEAEPTVLKDEVAEIAPSTTTISANEVKSKAQILKNQLEEAPTASGNRITADDISPSSSAFIITAESENDSQLPSKEDSFMRYILPGERAMMSNMGFAVAKDGFRVIKGFVKDSEGYPLIGANILEVGTENGVISDMDGFFTITVADQKNVQLRCNYLGYETAFIPLDEQENYQIILNEDALVLSEVVVTASGIETSSKSIAYSMNTVNKKNEPSNKQAKAQPVLGFNALKDYIRQNTPNIVGRGKIRLRFTINENGRPTHIRVVHSTNHSLDALAIQLISSGPGWSVINGDAPVEVEYRVRIR